MISCTLGALAAASVVTPSSVARADDGAEAMRIFEEAITLYNAGEYARAATGFMKAYQLKPAAVLLYNAARARGKLAGDDPAKLEAALELLERAQAQTELPLDERLSAEAAAYNDELVAQIAQARRLQAERRQAELDALKSNPDNYTRMGALGWAGVGALAAGGVSLGVAGYFNNNVRLAGEALAGPDTSRAEYDRLAADFTENQDAGRAFAVIGASLMVAGAGVLVYELVTLEYDGPATPERALARPRGRVRVGVGPMSARLEVTF
jgi:tetratricopeptide (TPR) repeat protein